MLVCSTSDTIMSRMFMICSPVLPWRSIPIAVSRLNIEGKKCKELVMSFMTSSGQRFRLGARNGLVIDHLIVLNIYKLCHHFIDLIMIDGNTIPANIVTGSVLLTVNHATDELLIRSFIFTTILYTCLGSIVEKLIVLHPQRHIPSLVSCPT